jgi:hypothetical protein
MQTIQKIAIPHKGIIGFSVSAKNGNFDENSSGNNGDGTCGPGIIDGGNTEGGTSYIVVYLFFLKKVEQKKTFN